MSMWDIFCPDKENITMDSIVELQKRLLPDLLQVMQKRYSILRYIRLMQPVGRRSLAGSLSLTERVLRSEVEFLKDQDLIDISSVGMSLTSEGTQLVKRLENVMREISGITEVERLLQRQLQIKKVIVVSGDSDESPWVKSELGRATAHCMIELLKGKNIIAVTGGTTMASVAEMLTSNIQEKELLFVPARGGFGDVLKTQANTICAMMAEKTGTKHRVLYVPDQVSDEIYDSFVKEPYISEVLKLLHSASMVLHGIGDAITMAEHRNSSPEVLEKLKNQNAVGEAFGYYFNESGEVVHKVLTVGLQLEDIENIQHVVAVAGGASKAKAIRAYMKQAPRTTILITDEGAAKQMLVD
jgi:central glycolytic genes regulator